MKLKYFSLWRDSSLCYASFRMTKFCFYSQLGSCIIGELFLKRKVFLSSLCFKVAKLAKFIRYEAVWKVCLFSITKFTEMEWNDCIFKRTKEHRRCSGKPYIIWDSYGMTNDVYMNRFVILYHKVHGVRVKWLRFWGHWGTSEIFCEEHYNLRFLRNDKVASTSY